jgi:hypothetical protein
VSLLRSLRLCASNDGEGRCRHRALFDTPIGDRHPGGLGYGTMDGAGQSENHWSHDDLA